MKINFFVPVPADIEVSWQNYGPFQSKDSDCYCDDACDFHSHIRCAPLRSSRQNFPPQKY